MATLTVRKDGSGAHTQIQSAIFDAVSGDIIDIGPGTYNENVEFQGKNLTLKGAGKDLTIIQGKLSNDTFTGCSWFAGDSVITTTSTSGMVRGKPLSNAYLGAGSRVSQIISGTKFGVSVATSTSGNYSKTAASVTMGTNTIVLPSTTSVAVGHKVEGAGVNGVITAWNSTTRVITIDSIVGQSGTNVVLNFRIPRAAQTITQTTNPASLVPATITFNGTSDGIVLQDLCAIGFDGTPAIETAALGFSGSAAPGHQNFLIERCRFTANGDSAVMSGGSPYIQNGTFQDCVFDGKTFMGSEPADVPTFGTSATTAEIVSIGASSSVIRFASMRGVVVGSTMTSSSWSATATVSAVNGNDATINKVVTGSVGATISLTITNIAFTQPNVARNLVYIGQNVSPCNTANITFRRNQITGQTGSIISANGGKTMFNSAVTIESVGGLVEDNVIDGLFGAGDPNALSANYAIRCRQANIVVQNNTNKVTGGRGNSGFYITGAGATNLNNRTVAMGVVASAQASQGAQPVANMDKDQIKAVSKVAASPTFSSEANWVQVSYIFKHTGSAKRMIATFRSYAAEKTDDMPLRGGMPGDQYQLVKVILCASGRSLMSIKRSELPDPSLSDFTLL